MKPLVDKLYIPVGLIENAVYDRLMRQNNMKGLPMNQDFLRGIYAGIGYSHMIVQLKRALREHVDND